MAKFGGIQGTPWHLERYHIEERERRRHRSHCEFYDRGTKYCSMTRSVCYGASHCKYYRFRKKAKRSSPDTETESNIPNRISESEKRKAAIIEVGSVVTTKGKGYLVIEKPEDKTGLFICRRILGNESNGYPELSTLKKELYITQIDTHSLLSDRVVQLLRANGVFPTKRKKSVESADSIGHPLRQSDNHAGTSTNIPKNVSRQEKAENLSVDRTGQKQKINTKDKHDKKETVNQRPAGMTKKAWDNMTYAAYIDLIRFIHSEISFKEFCERNDALMKLIGVDDSRRDRIKNKLLTECTYYSYPDGVKPHPVRKFRKVLYECSLNAKNRNLQKI